ncbi:MAG: hypothetical protein GYA50_01600 [Eubacteriaceae bacterium]|nr:hypothetical protein [Eubacteriaceae bacterium]
MKNLNKLKTENTLARLKIALQKEYDIDSYVKKFFKSIVKNTKSGCAKLNIVLHKEIDFDYYVKKSLKTIIESTKCAYPKIKIVLHKEVDFDYYVKKLFKSTVASGRRAYPKIKTALLKEYDIDSYVKKALSSFGVFTVKCASHIISAVAFVSAKARKILISLSEFAASKRIIIIDALKQRRNNKVKARLEQERENIAFLTEFLNSLKEEFGADISFSLVSINNDEDEFITIT